VPAFSHVVVIVFENKDFGEVIGNAEAPTKYVSTWEGTLCLASVLDCFSRR
jgi:hypothetical protein